MYNQRDKKNFTSCFIECSLCNNMGDSHLLSVLIFSPAFSVFQNAAKTEPSTGVRHITQISVSETPSNLNPWRCAAEPWVWSPRYLRHSFRVSYPSHRTVVWKVLTYAEVLYWAMQRLWSSLLSLYIYNFRDFWPTLLLALALKSYKSHKPTRT